MKYFSDLTWIFILPVISQLQFFVGQSKNIQKIGQAAATQPPTVYIVRHFPFHSVQSSVADKKDIIHTLVILIQSIETNKKQA